MGFFREIRITQLILYVYKKEEKINYCTTTEKLNLYLQYTNGQM